MYRLRRAADLPTSRILTALALLGALAACGGGGGGGMPVDGGSTFHIASTNPANGAQNVPVDSSVRVTFSQPVDPETVTTASLRVGMVEGSGEVRGTTGVDPADPSTLVWLPSARMTALTAHACLISSALRSASGLALTGSLQFAFRTGAPPTLPGLPGPDDLRQTLGRLNIGRRSHTATLLSGGSVLLAGGYVQGSDVTDIAEIFQPSIEQFTVLSARMTLSRAGHTATRLQDGRVLLTGGWTEPSPGQLVVTAGAEVYEPGSQSFHAVGDMTTPRVDHAATLLSDGRVLVTGGSNLEGDFLADLDSAEVFDPASGTFSPLLVTMTHTRATHVMLPLGGGRIVLVGGSDVDLQPEYFDLVHETFAPLATPFQESQRWGPMGATFASGAGIVAGGDTLGSVLYVPADGAKVENSGSGLGSPRAYGTATTYASDRILVVGGFDFSRGLYMLSSSDVVAEGGIAGSSTYETTMHFPTPMVYHTATLLQDGRVLFCGGLNPDGGKPELDGAYVFTPPGID